jgi:hypothetical protein
MEGARLKGWYGISRDWKLRDACRQLPTTKGRHAVEYTFNGGVFFQSTTNTKPVKCQISS